MPSSPIRPHAFPSWLVLAVLALASLVLAPRVRAQAAVAPHVPDVVLVAFRPDVPLPARGAAIEAAGLQVDPTVRSPHFVRLRLGPEHRRRGVPVMGVVQQLRQDPRVRVAEPDYLLFPRAVPNDPRFGEQWCHRNLGQTGGTPGADIGSTFAWDTLVGSDQVVVAVIDTGVDYNHPDLFQNILRDQQGNVVGFDFLNNDPDPMDDDVDSHGTHVAGIVGARGNNLMGVTGVCQTVKIMPLKFLGPSGGPTSAAIQCIDFATVRQVPISNNSWGGPAFSQLLLDAILRARAGDQLFVTASGNSGQDNDQVPDFPGNFRLVADNVVNVAATNHRDQLAGFSNFGATTVDCGAPGAAILSTTRNNTYGLLDGTSMASPQVAGACALMLAQNLSQSYLQLKQRLYANLVPIPSLQGRTVTGGRLSIQRALLSIRVVAPNGGEVWRVGTSQAIRWESFGFSAGSTVKIELSRNAGLTWESLDPAHPNDGEFTWTVAGPLSNFCRVRVTSNQDTNISDRSDASFRIVDGSFALLAPNGGELVRIGGTMEVRWNAAGFVSEVPTVVLEISRDGGVTFQTLLSATPNDGVQEVAVTGPETTQALVRAYPTGEFGFADQSDAPFEIRLPSSVTVNVPNGGETVAIGDPLLIEWQTTGFSGPVRIERSNDGGVSWITVFPSTPNDGQEPYVVSGPATAVARVRITALEDPQGTDTSNGVFRVVEKSLRILSPAGGARLLVDRPAFVEYQTVGLPFGPSGERLRVELSRDGGDSFEVLSDEHRNTGFFPFLAGGPPAPVAVLRMTSLDTPGLGALSAPFSLVAPTLFLTSPNGRESWRVGDQQLIRWSGTCVGTGTVTVELSRNGGRSFQVIAGGVPNNGAFAYGVQGKPTRNALVRITWDDDPALIDLSDRTFRIVRGRGR